MRHKLPEVEVPKGTRLLNPVNGKKENASRIFEMHANNRIPLDEVHAGNIVAIVGIKESYTGDTLCDSENPIVLERMTFPEPVISMSIEPKTQADKSKLSEALLTIRRGEDRSTSKVRRYAPLWSTKRVIFVPSRSRSSGRATVSKDPSPSFRTSGGATRTTAA